MEGAGAADVTDPGPVALDPGDSAQHRTQDWSSPREAGVCAACRAAGGEGSLTNSFLLNRLFV